MSVASRRRASVQVLLVLLLFASAAVLAGGGVAPAHAPSHAGRVPVPTIAPGRDRCVADPGYMRRNHMDFLRHARDRTVREGVRTGGATLEGCLQCHAVRTADGNQASGERFCDSCHRYAAVKLDCFECHAGTTVDEANRSSR